MANPFALLDVDDTLCIRNGDSTTYNDALLNSLLKKGIRDITLFTDMSFDTTTIPHRIEVVKHLKEKGFNVHGVITPCDLVWSQLSSSNFDEVSTALSSHKGRYDGDKFENFLRNNALFERFIPYRPKENAPGCSYAAAVKECSTVDFNQANTLPNRLKERSLTAKAFADQLAAREGYIKSEEQGKSRGHTKALMLDFFLHHKPHSVSSILIADDRKEVIEGIETYKKEKNPEVLINTLQVEDFDEEGKYESVIEAHLSQDPHWKIHHLIDEHIKVLRSSRHPFLSSPDAKIATLIQLKSDISKADSKGTVGFSEIITNWENSPSGQTRNNASVSTSQLISYHRNRLFGDPNQPTKTHQFINQLKEQFQPSAINEGKMEI